MALQEISTILSSNLEENTQTLRRKIDLLISRKVDVDESLQNAAYHSGKKRKREVEDWRNNVENIIKKFETLEQRVQESSRFYHVFARQELDEQLKRMTKEVTELDDQSNFPSGLFLDVDENIDRLLLTPEPNGQAFLQNLDDICTSLMDDGIFSIGIYGMGGVGKTTLAMLAYNKLLSESMFSGHVYWVTVSQEFSTYKLQSDIAQKLKLDITIENDERIRAALLLRAFQEKGRFVLILDDVWKQIDTGKIGIPFKRDGFKLLITSRSEEVCHRMGCKKIIKVNTLLEQEALDLFMKTLDRDDLSLEVKEICKTMARKCGGLPLALITLARSMRAVNDICEWRDALERLKESCIGQPDMKDEVLPILLYSYNRLRDTRLKSCFLYCCLYPEDCRIPRDKLIKKFISEEMMESRLNLQAEIDQGHAILNQLVRACLLERSSNGSVKMHDLIREMAIGVTKDKPRYMVKAALGLKELPEEQKWTDDLEKVSLMDNSIREISPGTSPKCPRLSTLFLNGNYNLQLIPDCFFTQMCGIRTLDLSFTRILGLPNSISDLEKLNALLLEGCKNLVQVPSLEKLRALRQLDLTDTRIEEVPQGMENLTNLKFLYMYNVYLYDVPVGILSRCTHLQELKFPYPVVLPEGLKHLELFDGVLNSVSDLNRLIKSQLSEWRLNSYKIFVEHPIEDFDDIPFDPPHKVIYFGDGSLTGSSLDVDEILLPRDIEELYFRHSGLSCCLLDCFPMLNNARDLKKCDIYNEDDLEYIMKLSSAEEEEQSRGVPFQSLEYLYLDWAKSFMGLLKWERGAPISPGTFSQLKTLSIDYCNKMKKVFQWSLVQNLHNLQNLYVSHCKEIVEIIGDDGDHDGEDPTAYSSANVTLPKLEGLRLQDLSKLKSICKGTINCFSIKSIFINRCTELKKVPLHLQILPDGSPSAPPFLKDIEIGRGEKIWWESLEWDHPNDGDVLLPFVRELLYY